MEDARAIAIAAVRAEMAQWAEDDKAIRLPRRSRRRLTTPSVVFAIRLDPSEVTALESRAEQFGIKPSVLARNLIRVGLIAGRGDALPRAIDQVQAAVEELRSLVGERR